MKLINEFEVLANEECWLDDGLIYLKDEPIGKFYLDDTDEEVLVVFEVDSKKLKMELEDVEQSAIFEDTKIELLGDMERCQEYINKREESRGEPDADDWHEEYKLGMID